MKVKKGNAWKFQREAQKRGSLPGLNDIKYTIMDIKNDRDRALLSILYLSAGRISEVLAVKARDFEKTRKKNREIFLITMPNRKHKKRHYKSIPIPMDRKENRYFVGVIENYSKRFGRNEKLFNITKQRVWQIMRKKIDMNPHFMRHIRLTHLTTMYGMREQQLIMYAGWTDGRPTKHYMELKWDDLLDVL